uniref:Uncharacterized protein n=1 Tax=Spyridia filamentosa TaxID=196632 RepID=A0A1Z1MJ89_SPYFI|nr:hypothetical protein [Spyridia filamentosa]ARW66123.1 hypothetical protein [Spyridia filamentosa]
MRILPKQDLLVKAIITVLFLFCKVLTIYNFLTSVSLRSLFFLDFLF